MFRFSIKKSGEENAISGAQGKKIGSRKGGDTATDKLAYGKKNQSNDATRGGRHREEHVFY